MKTFARLEKGDFIWRVRTDNGNVVTSLSIVEKAVKTASGTFKIECNNVIIAVRYDDVLRKSFVFEHTDNDVLFTNEAVFEKYVKLKKMEICNKQKEKQESNIKDLEAAINGASEFLKKKLNSINEVR